MITTSHEDWADRARWLREHAMSVSAADRHGKVLAPAETYLEVGYNYRMTDLQAAIGLVQLSGCPRSCSAGVNLPRPTRSRSTTSLVCVRWLILRGDECNFQSFWVEVAPNFPLSREELLTRLAEADISARRGIMSAHRQPPYASTFCARQLARDRAADRQHADPAAVPPDE